MSENESRKSYGRTRSGVEITDEVIEKWVAEAQAGLDLSNMRVVYRRPLSDEERKRLRSFPEAS